MRKGKKATTVPIVKAGRGEFLVQLQHIFSLKSNADLQRCRGGLGFLSSFPFQLSYVSQVYKLWDLRALLYTRPGVGRNCPLLAIWVYKQRGTSGRWKSGVGMTWKNEGNLQGWKRGNRYEEWEEEQGGRISTEK